MLRKVPPTGPPSSSHWAHTLYIVIMSQIHDHSFLNLLDFLQI